MKKFVPLITVLLIFLSPSHAEPPVKSYEMGFETMTVFEYKRALKKDGEDIPKFPPRTGNALIVQSVEKDSRAMKAGLENNDLIRIVNGRLIRSSAEADKIFKKVTYKDDLELGVIRRRDDKWKRVTLKLQPITERKYLVSSILAYEGCTKEYLNSTTVHHKSSPISKFSHRNIQLYYSEITGQSSTLYLRLGILKPGTANEGGFVIKTDNAVYKIAEEKEIDKREIELNEKLAEANKLEEAEYKKNIEAEKKYKAAKTAYDAEFKDFKIDKNRKDANYKKLRQRELESFTRFKEMSKISTEAAKKYLAALRRSKEITEVFKEYEKEKIKQLNQKEKQKKERFTAVYNQLSPIEAERALIASKNVRQGFEPRQDSLSLLELHHFDGPIIAKMKMDQGWKWYDAPLKKSQLKMIEDIFSSRKVTVHFDTAPDKPFEVTPEQKERMKIVLKMFKADGGKIAE